MVFHLFYAGIHTCHKNIGRTAGLINSHKSPYQPVVHAITAIMKYCCLCHGRHRLMKTLNYYICSQFCCRYRKIVGKMKMSSMRLIHDKRNIISVNDLRNPFHIRHHSIISRGSYQHCCHIRGCCQHSFHFVRRNSSVYPPVFICLWINVNRCKISQIHGMINCFVTVSGHKNLSSIRNCG